MKQQTVYLVAYYSMRPKNRVQTQVKGWMDDTNNIQFDEQVAVTTKLKKHDQSYAKIILDMSNKKIVRNHWNGTANFDDMFEYFAKGYPRYTYELMGQIDPEYVTQFMTKLGSLEEIQQATQSPQPLLETISNDTVVVDTSNLSS